MEIIDAEYYFIQLLFCNNKELLRKQYRDIYDALFIPYKKTYEEGRNKQIDLMDINKKFIKWAGYLL